MKPKMKINYVILNLVILTTILFGQTNSGIEYREIRKNFYKVEVDSTENSKIYKVRIWGEIRNPGVYLVPQYSSLIDIVAIAGGPTEQSDLSNISVTSMSKDKVDRNIIDLEYFFENGKFRTDPIIAEETVIIIEKSKSKKFFDSLPRVLNVLNIISITILLVNWLS